MYFMSWGLTVGFTLDTSTILLGKSLGVCDPSIHPDLLAMLNSNALYTTSQNFLLSCNWTVNPNVGHMTNSLTSTDTLHGCFSGEDGLSQQFSGSILQCFRLPSLRFRVWQTVLTCKLGHRAGRPRLAERRCWVISFPCVRVTSYYPQDSPRPRPSHDRFPATTFSRSRDLPTRTRGGVRTLSYLLWGQNLHRSRQMHWRPLITHQLWVERVQIYMC